MSDMLALAKAIESLTAALLQNGAALGASPQADAAAPPATSRKTTKGSATTASEPSAAQPAPSPDPSPDADVEAQFALVKKAVLDGAKTDRDAMVALLAEFGAAKAQDIKPADYEAFLERAAAPADDLA